MGIAWALVIVVVGFLLGLAFQKGKPTLSQSTSILLSKFSLYFLIPFSVLSSLWQLPSITAQLIYLPFIGVAVIGVGIVVGFICRRYFQLNDHQFGALLPVTAFYNLGALGNLIVFVTIGENGIALLALFKLCEELIYFGWTFPYTRALNHSKNQSVSSRKPFWNDPVFIVALCAVVAGVLLNQFELPRPQNFADFLKVTVPLSSFLMITAVGMTFNVSGGKKWCKLGVSAAVLRSFGAILIVAILLSVLDLWGAYQGDLARVCLLLAVMPTAFMSVLPSVLYDLDKSLANTTWLISFLVSLLVIPATILFLL
ncbi:hypothetical protein KP803_15065 [Vibrio sp. ZSDE26]|uniref:AEC family transporter n=1 Tax=Vibrio amylolyticus TaxID=2847292 RepID=A0A9X1XKN4_9VIBR|nr:AEC family transporter [Vibrio amylolyticus]MCK6264599.1 hypothetical protein [Vibrio amylolyticus]